MVSSGPLFFQKRTGASGIAENHAMQRILQPVKSARVNHFIIPEFVLADS